MHKAIPASTGANRATQNGSANIITPVIVIHVMIIPQLSTTAYNYQKLFKFYNLLTLPRP